MRTRIFHTKFWTDDYVLSLNSKEKILLLYYITNENIGMTGIYEISNKTISLNTGLSIKDIEKIDLKFQGDKKIVRYKTWIKIVNHTRYQLFNSPKHTPAIVRERAKIPAEVLTALDRVSVGYPYPTDTLINKKQVNSNKKIGEVQEGKVPARTQMDQTIKYLEALTEEDIRYFTKSFKVNTYQLSRKAKELGDYCRMHKKGYADPKAFLRNAIRRDYGEIEQAAAPGRRLSDKIPDQK